MLEFCAHSNFALRMLPANKMIDITVDEVVSPFFGEFVDVGHAFK